MDKDSFKNRISSREAIKIIKNNTKKIDFEFVKIKDSLNRVLREDIYSKYPSPIYNVSAMDGFCLSLDKYIEGKKYKISGKISAGDGKKRKIKDGSVFKIMTGAVVPDRFDLVIPVEDSKEEGGFVSFSGKFSKWENIRLKGEEFDKGEKILKEGKILRAQDLGLIASQGINSLKVSKIPEAKIIITGNEIVKSQKKLPYGKIFDSNGILISSLSKFFQVNVKEILYIKDDFEKIKDVFKKKEEVDFFITTGGISMGEDDFTLNSFEEAGGKILFKKVRQKPGGPFSFGLKDEKPYFFLPGNPLSAFLNYFYYISYFLKNYLGIEENILNKKTAYLEKDLSFKKKRTEFIIIELFEKDGKFFAEPIEKQASYMLSSLSKADGILVKDEEVEEFKKGERVEILSLKGGNFGI